MALLAAYTVRRVFDNPPTAPSYTWRVQVEYRNGEVQDTFSDGDIPDTVLALLERIADLFAQTP